MSRITTLSLRDLLLLDAATCAATGALLTLGSKTLSGWSDIPSGVLFPAGLILFPIAAFMLVAARVRTDVPLVLIVVIGNVAWVVASIVLLFIVRPNAAGSAFVLMQALVVAGLAVMERRAFAGPGVGSGNEYGTKERAS